MGSQRIGAKAPHRLQEAPLDLATEPVGRTFQLLPASPTARLKGDMALDEPAYGDQKPRV